MVDGENTISSRHIYFAHAGLFWREKVVCSMMMIIFSIERPLLILRCPAFHSLNLQNVWIRYGRT